VKDSDRDKLDPKAKKCVFIGYGSDDMGYRFWDESKRKVIRSRDVTFYENGAHKDHCGAESNVTKEVEDKEEALLEDITEDDLAGNSRNSVHGNNEEMAPATPVPEVRRSSRVTRPPERFSPSLHYLLLTENGEPQCYTEAVQMDDSVKWESAMNEEIMSLEKNETWSLTKLPAGKKALQNKWVFRVKEEHDGSKRYKARLVVKGFQQKKGIDYNEIFSPVVKMTTIRLVLGIVAAENLHLEQLDVKTAFLHGDLEEDLYMVQPEGFRIAGKEDLVCKLGKSLYGLKQAPRQWYLKFDDFMMRNGYTRCVMDHCCYVKHFKGSYIILLLYVDDMLIAGSNMVEINKLKRQMSEEFEMKDLGEAKQILGMSISRDRSDGNLKLSQEKYIGKILNKFSLQDAKVRSTPLGSHFKLTREQSPKTDKDMEEMTKVPYASAVGSLMYAMVCTRPDIAHAVGVVSRFMSNPGREHWEAVKWLFRYLKGTSKVALHFKKNDVILEGFSDADLGGCLDTRKSTTGYIFTLGGTAVSWMSRLQKSVALSTTEAEYMAISEAGKEMIWLKSFLEELGKKQADSSLYSDSQSAIHLAKNPVFHARTKHIQLRYHFIRGLMSDGTLSLKKVLGSKNPADMLTKVVTTEKLKLCIASAGLHG
jgi:ATP-binding cassette subfamily B (MDR/TAP) protein 1